MQTSHRLRLGAISVATALVIGLAPLPSAFGDPENLDTLIATMEQVSREAEAQAEQVKHLEQDLEAKEAEVADYERRVDEATKKADEAKENARRTQEEVDRIALAKYRGANVDPITSVASATSPQSAIDRTAYLQALARRTEHASKELEKAAAEASEAHSQASRAQAEAQFQLAQLRKERETLDEKRAELEQRTNEIRSRVDALEAEQRQRWENKNGPTFEFDPELINGENPAGVDAVKAALSKVGSPYSWGATGPDAFDCSGLMVWAYQQQGKSIPRTSQAQMGSGIPIPKDKLQPGDLIGYYPGATHVGMYIGDGKVVHAADYGIPVQVVSFDAMPFVGARRY
ncbi:NlpC/P60 family protein [Corynebacterium aquilae]|uniref:Hydrolase n=1 Tax=Corynebacterium aquilae DSM 44791 TaxID=1431546 RepID=A0A1L7CH00_9CORY|nr:NlpC/P60 family protein [Corynebacterium aquilae]APT85116.1 hydrolase [Corynebacterium aquilae DSM 44791]